MIVCFVWYKYICLRATSCAVGAVLAPCTGVHLKLINYLHSDSLWVWVLFHRLIPALPFFVSFLFVFTMEIYYLYYLNHRNYILIIRIMKARQVQVRYTVVNIHITFLNTRRYSPSQVGLYNQIWESFLHCQSTAHEHTSFYSKYCFLI